MADAKSSKPDQDTTSATLPHVSREAFRDGMAHLAGAVNIVTTDGPAGRAGFTATAVCSVTDTPPTLLVCVNLSSSVAPAFLENTALCVNTVGPDLAELAMAFGGKLPVDERFIDEDWSADVTGAPCLKGAAVSFDCHVTARQEIGTHAVLFCEVLSVVRADSPSASVYYARKFHALES
ncbi:flavin reductase [uncultured Celeribacter sp.]|uniref:flavin reductase n=1 Tax=uncultured Celeribacter sp. TaxID=1303376 RepID=UPI002AA702F4|nr:flavin reductase [uncultured Celeribacter sp.]